MTNIPQAYLEEWWVNAVGSAFGFGAEAVWQRVTEAELDAHIADADIAFAIWVEQRSTTGFLFLCVKGFEYYLGTVTPTKENLITRCIPCIDRAAAEKLLTKYGDSQWPPQLSETQTSKSN